MHGNFRAVRLPFPADHRPLQGHMRILGRMQGNEMRLVHRVFGALEPVAIIMAGTDMALAIFAQKEIVIGQ
jgi:hypothetical protein